jgi:hypothetical protein
MNLWRIGIADSLLNKANILEQTGYVHTEQIEGYNTAKYVAGEVGLVYKTARIKPSCAL